MSLEIREDGTVLVRVPYRMPDTEIQRFIREKADWIAKHLQMQEERKRQRQEQPEEYLSMQEIRKLADRALVEIPKRVAHYA